MLQTEFQPRVDLKMYLNRWTTKTCYFNYSDSGRNLHTRGSYTSEYFLADNYMFSIFYVCEDFY